MQIESTLVAKHGIDKERPPVAAFFRKPCEKDKNQQYRGDSLRVKADVYGRIMMLIMMLLLGLIHTEVALPRLEKVWRKNLDGQSMGLYQSKDGSILLNVRQIVWNKEHSFVKEFDQLQSLCMEGKTQPLFNFPDRTRGHFFLNDGRQCLIRKGYQSHDLELWDVASGKPLVSTSFGFGKGTFQHIAFSSDDKDILVQHRSAIEHWDVKTLTLQRTFPQPEENLWLNDLVISKDNQWLGLYARNVNYQNQPGDLVIWDYQAKMIIRTIPLQESPRYTKFTPDGKYIMAGSEQGTIWIWEMSCPEPQPKYTLKGHTKPFVTVQFHPDRALVITTSLDNSVKLWDLTTQQAIASNAFPNNGLAMHAQFTRDGKHVLMQGNVKADTPDGKFKWSGFVTLAKLPK